MATVNIAVSYPDGQGTRIMTALKDRVKRENNPTGSGAEPTNAEVMAWLKAQVTETIRTTVRQYEAREAARVAVADATALPLDVT